MLSVNSSMASIYCSPSSILCKKPSSLPFVYSTFQTVKGSLSLRFQALKIRNQDFDDQAVLRKPVILPSEEDLTSETRDFSGNSHDDLNGSRTHRRKKGKRKDEDWIDWEDQILQDTVPLVSFVRMLLHSGKYESGDRLSPDHEKAILEKLLPYHPDFEKKIGCGVDFIKIGYHQDFENSKCLFIVRKDGDSVDFSYWKCIKGLIRKNYPLYADGFILRHFRKPSK